MNDSCAIVCAFSLSLSFSLDLVFSLDQTRIVAIVVQKLTKRQFAIPNGLKVGRRWRIKIEYKIKLRKKKTN